MDLGIVWGLFGGPLGVFSGVFRGKKKTYPNRTPARPPGTFNSHNRDRLSIKIIRPPCLQGTGRVRVLLTSYTYSKFLEVPCTVACH